MKYVKNFHGFKVVKNRNEGFLLGKYGFVYNPSEELLEKYGWEVYAKDEQELLDIYKKELIKKIKQYDASNAINTFIINGNNVWLDKATRVGLMLRLQSEQQVGNETTTLWYNNTEFIIPVETAILMLQYVEIYASKCYDNTQKHIATVMALDNIEDIKYYNYTTGYPEQLSFNTSLI